MMMPVYGGLFYLRCEYGENCICDSVIVLLQVLEMQSLWHIMSIWTQRLTTADNEAFMDRHLIHICYDDDSRLN